MRNYSVLLLIMCLVVSSLITFTVAPVSAQADYKLSVPQFSVNLVDNSYDVPPSTTTTVDPYTGKETTTNYSGRHVVDRTIEVTIKNQPFTSFTNASGHQFDLYYIIEMKGHYSENWERFNSNMFGAPFCKQYGSEDVVKQVSANNYEDGSQLEFRVKAVVAYDASIIYDDWLRFGSQYLLDEHVTSGYSSVKTLVIGSGSPSQTATWPPVTSDGNDQPQYPDQTQPPDSIFTNPLFTLVIGVILGGIVVAMVMTFLKRHIKTPTYASNLLCQMSEEGLYA